MKTFIKIADWYLCFVVDGLNEDRHRSIVRGALAIADVADSVF